MILSQRSHWVRKSFSWEGNIFNGRPSSQYVLGIYCKKIDGKQWVFFRERRVLLQFHFALAIIDADERICWVGEVSWWEIKLIAELPAWSGLWNCGVIIDCLNKIDSSYSSSRGGLYLWRLLSSNNSRISTANRMRKSTRIQRTDRRRTIKASTVKKKRRTRR